MANTLKIAAGLYNKPPKTAIPGARVTYDSVSVLTTDLITTQLIALAVLPAGHRLMDAELETADLDSGTAALTISVGILNTYYNQAAASASVPAAYNSGGATDTNVDPQLVTGQNILTSSTLGQAGGRAQSTLAFSAAIGVDYTKDRIIAVQFPVLPGAAQAGTLGIILTIDED
jgi:hypothetical protein